MSDFSRCIRPIFICRVFTELFSRCSTPPLSVSGGRRLLSSRVAESGAGSSCRRPQVPIYILTGHQHLSDLGLSGPAGRRLPNYTPDSELCSPLHWTQRSSITLISFCGPLASAPVVPGFSRGVNENVVRIWKVSFILPPFFPSKWYALIVHRWGRQSRNIISYFCFTASQNVSVQLGTIPSWYLQLGGSSPESNRTHHSQPEYEMDWVEKIQSSPNPRATDCNPVQSSWWPRSWIQSSPIRTQQSRYLPNAL